MPPAANRILLHIHWLYTAKDSDSDGRLTLDGRWQGQVWARAADRGVRRERAESMGSGGWSCVQTAAGAERPGGTACCRFGLGVSRTQLLSGSPAGLVTVFQTAAMAPYLSPPGQSAGLGAGDAAEGGEESGADEDDHEAALESF